MRLERLVLRRGEKPAHRINSICVVAFLTAASGIFVRRLSFPLDSHDKRVARAPASGRKLLRGTGFESGTSAHIRGTDKAFRIGTPMLKALWTRRFAAGWGERGAANALRERGQSS